MTKSEKIRTPWRVEESVDCSRRRIVDNDGDVIVDNVGKEEAIIVVSVINSEK